MNDEQLAAFRRCELIAAAWAAFLESCEAREAGEAGSQKLVR